MRVLLSTIGSRGDVQPILALAVELQLQGFHARLCAPPDFRELVEGIGVAFVPVGPAVRSIPSRAAAAEAPSPEAMRQLVADTIAGQFAILGEAAAGCDVIVASTALQYAAHSIAEQRGIPYYFAAYSPVVLPSPHHPPVPLPGQPVVKADADNVALWDQQARHWNEFFGPALNAQRAALGLDPVPDVRRYMFTDRPLLAADPTLAPWPTPSDLRVTQTGAWMLQDRRPLPAEVEAFLEAGEPPVYFGFGSTHTPKEASRAMIEAARALGRRALVLSGWADLALVDDQSDCLSLSEVNLQALFPRVAAVVHHGGAGTTTVAALAGAPQVVFSQRYDQYYFAERVESLGVGVAHASTAPTKERLVTALQHALRPEVLDRARSLANVMRTDGAPVAVKHVTR